MASQDRTLRNNVEFEGDEPQLGAPTQPSPSLPPPPPPRTNVLNIYDPREGSFYQPSSSSALRLPSLL